MIRFAARRLMAIVPLLWIVLTLVFLLMQLAPGDPFDVEAQPGVSPGASAALREAFGTRRPAAVRYVEWLGRLATGDFGVSPSLRQPVLELVARAAANTLRLSVLALALQFAAGILLGAVAAAWRGRWIDRLVTSGSSLLYAVPSYWLAMVLIWIFSVRLGWLPASQMRSLDAQGWPGPQRFGDALRHLLLPCLSLVLPAAAGVALYVRETLAAALRRGYVRSARARGASHGAVVVRHGLRSVLLPVANLAGLALPGLVAGSAVIEVIFAWPGMGRLAYQAVLAHDQPLVLGCVWLISLTVLAGTLAADLVCAAVDPRVREATA